jgi:hypothetical protein
MDVALRKSDHKFSILGGDSLAKQMIRAVIRQVITSCHTLGSYHSKSPVGLVSMLSILQEVSNSYAHQ